MATARSSTVRDQSATLTRVFVYGSLLKGLGNHGAFLGKARFAGEGRAIGHWRMLDLGSFPGVIPAEAAGERGYSVVGEVYEVTAAELEALDRLEGVAHGMYSRTTVVLSSGAEAEMYVYQAGRSRSRTMILVPGNDWKAYLTGAWRDYLSAAAKA